MQNLDYGKRFRKEKTRQAPIQRPKPAEPVFSKPSPKKNSSQISDFFSKVQVNPLPVWYYFIIGILLFTSGVFVGMKLDQKESHFASNEMSSFRNVPNADTISTSEPEASVSAKPEIQESPGSGREDTLDSGNLASVPKNLQFPPKINQVNYIIQLGNFSREDSTKWAASLIREKQEFQGRIFRTSTGKLYLGYYYDLKEAKAVLKKVKKFQGGAFQEASIKNIQF